MSVLKNKKNDNNKIWSHTGFEPWTPKLLLASPAPYQQPLNIHSRYRF